LICSRIRVRFPAPFVTLDLDLETPSAEEPKKNGANDTPFERELGVGKRCNHYEINEIKVEGVNKKKYSKNSM